MRKSNNTKSGAIHSRYSNYGLDPGTYSGFASYNSYGGTGGLSGGLSGSGVTGSGAFDYASLINTGIAALSNVFTSIFGKSDKYQLQAYQQVYEEQKKVTTILWVVIGLMAALGIYLLIRKTK